jgi:hypothetical protein
VGAWQKYLPVFYDGLWRGAFCLILVAAMMLPQFQSKVKNDHPKL